MKSVRPALLFVILTLAAMLLPRPSALAQPKPPGAPAPEGSADLLHNPWIAQVDAWERWLEAHRKDRCTEHCFYLEHLRIQGAVPNSLQFELSGGVLAQSPVRVPLFGPPSKVRIESVVEDNKPAAIGFEGDHYYVWTNARRFVLKGTLVLQGDLALTIPGPLNSLTSDLKPGRITEGERLSGLLGTTIHFDAVADKQQRKEPPVFQLSRAIRVAREITFEYRLVMRSGEDLGVVRLPLRSGERVLDVTGSNGWKVEGNDVVLPTAGASASITLTGRMDKPTTYTPDDRSAYEWWLLESDPEHRLTVTGDAHQVDVKESPIPRSQPNARLFLLHKGQQLQVAVNALVAKEVLAAVVRQHSRTLVVTRQGDLVMDDTLQYENNGIDYLRYSPVGRPIYLATDQIAERLMHPEGGSEVLIPLRVGGHSLRTQAVGTAALSLLGGTLDLPYPAYPLTASRAELNVRVPAQIYPLLLLGGDQLSSPLDWDDLVVFVLALVTGWLAFKTWSKRLLGSAVLLGLWLLVPWLYAIVQSGLVLGALLWALGRLVGEKAALAVRIGVGVVASLVAVVVVAGLLVGSRSASPPGPSARDYGPMPSAAPPSVWAPSVPGDSRGLNRGEVNLQRAQGGIVEGVTPVALTLPTFERSISAHRELVTAERPFRATLLYATHWTLWGLIALWLVCVGLLLKAHKDQLVRAWEGARQKLAKPSPPASPAPGPTEDSSQAQSR